MGRYVVRVAEEYYDMDDCDARGYPIKKIRYTGEEYETYVDPDGDRVECGPNGWEIHTVIGRGKPETPKPKYIQTKYEKNVERSGGFLYKKNCKKSILIECLCKNSKVVIIPECVKRIERLAFSRCFDLETIIIPPSVEIISPEAFIGERELGEHYNVTIKFAHGVKTIPNGLIPSNTSKLDNPFRWAHLVNKIVIPDSVTKIEENAFQKMDLISIILPDTIEEIGKGIFSESSVWTAYMPESSWVRFKDVMLEGCKRIKEVKSGTKLLYFNNDDIYSNTFEDYSEIGDEAFFHSDVMKAEKVMEYLISDTDGGKEKERRRRSELTIPTSIQSIGRRAFMGCTLLVKVTLPESLTYLGDEAFKDCVNLEEITLPKRLPRLGNNTFEGCSNLKKVLLSRNLYEESKWEFPDTTEFLFYDD